MKNIKTFELKFRHKISLRKTFDIQIPALEWIPISKNLYERMYIINSKHLKVTLTREKIIL